MKENYYNCIYMYTNKINGKRYIGQAKDFKRRHRQHINKYNNKYPIDCAFNKYGKENFEIKILAENIDSQEKLNEYEKFFIKRYNTLVKNGHGYNFSNGGHNGNTWEGKSEEEINKFKETCREIALNRTEEEIQKRVETFKKNYKKENHPNYGKKPSEETCKKKSESMKKYLENKENHPMYGRKGKDNPRSKKIAQYDLDGNLIRVWDNSKIAGKELGLSSGNINKCCNFALVNYDREKWFKTRKYTPQKFCGGFIWKYVEEVE